MVQLFIHATIIVLPWHVQLPHLKANGNTIIEEADAINKSYPDFYEHLASLSAIVNNKILQP